MVNSEREKSSLMFFIEIYEFYKPYELFFYETINIFEKTNVYWGPVIILPYVYVHSSL